MYLLLTMFDENVFSGMLISVDVHLDPSLVNNNAVKLVSIQKNDYVMLLEAKNVSRLGNR